MKSSTIENHWAKLVPLFHFDKPFKSQPDSEDGAKKAFASLLLLGLSYLKTQVPKWEKYAPVEIIHSSMGLEFVICAGNKMRSLQPGKNLL